MAIEYRPIWNEPHAGERCYFLPFDKAFAMHSIRFTPWMITLVCLFPASAAAQSDLSFEPYTVYVIEENAHARCGPSEEYYRTDPLRPGQALEVYAETDDGWLGIRPPENSFSWVQAESIELDRATDLGTVIEDRTVAWIGTHLGRARSYRWQIQLAEGEVVTVIGKSQREGPDGPQLWYRIVPPSGEYRWVRREQVVDSSEKLVQATSQAQRTTTLGDRFLDRPAEKPGTKNTRGTARRRTDRDSSGGTPEAAAGAKPQSDERQETAALADSNGESVLDSQVAQTGEPTENWQSNDNRLAVDHASAIAGQPTATSQPTSPQALEPSGSLATVEFIGRPKLLEIGSQPGVPQRTVVAGDGNWVTGTTARVVASPNTTAAANLSSPIAQVGGQAPLPPQSLATTAAPTAKPLQIVSTQRIAEIETETRNADIERLDLIFSRLMAAQATAAEIEPVGRAAQQLTTTATDASTAGRARMLAERTEQYQRIASRRDGPAVVGQAAWPALPLATSSAPLNVITEGVVTENAGTAASNETVITGYLVQVYSARSNSPPFALTDNSGRTLAYVTPTPGINLRVHLNSRVRVSGREGYLTGLNTPHILATTAVRSVE